MCSYIAEKVHWNTILLSVSQRSCHVRHCTCTHNVAIYSIFNIQEFEAAFSTLYCRLSNCNKHRKHWNAIDLSDDIAAILPNTALYLHPKCSHILYIQYTRVWSCFFQRYIVVQATVMYIEKLYTLCSYIEAKARWRRSVLSDDISTILPYKALYLKP